jgi:hypothetical protein
MGMAKLTAPQKAAQAGLAQAEADIAAGRLQYIHCFPDQEEHVYWADWVLQWRRAMKERLGLEDNVYLECPWAGRRSRQAFATEYNRRMKEEVARRFGADAESDLRREVCGW